MCYGRGEAGSEKGRGAMSPYMNNKGQQCDNGYKAGGIRLLCFSAPPGCSHMNITESKQHLAMTQMFVTLCVVREAAPSVKDQTSLSARFCTCTTNHKHVAEHTILKSMPGFIGHNLSFFLKARCLFFPMNISCLSQDLKLEAQNQS